MAEWYCAGLESNAREPVDLWVRMGSNPIPGAKIFADFLDE